MNVFGSSFWLFLAIAALVIPPIGRRWLRVSGRKVPKLSKTQQWVDQGCCHACGYNLRGVESYMCPECGTVRLYSARQWKAKLAADAEKEMQKQRA